jgi:hypothetical protein
VEVQAQGIAMPYLEFLWVDENVDHIAEHDVSTEEFEHVVRHPERRDVSHSSACHVVGVPRQRVDFSSACTKKLMTSGFIP